jgi:RHS repeat-associated protein
VDYVYDVNDNRTTKVVDINGAGTGAATTERYVYDGDQITLVFNGSGTQTHRYLYGDQIDQVLAEEANGQTRWLLADHQGTVRQIVDHAGTLLNQISYDSFGNLTNASVTFRFGYTGREWDGETGQYYYRARYYDPKVGRFTSEDAIGSDRITDFGLNSDKLLLDKTTFTALRSVAGSGFNVAADFASVADDAAVPTNGAFVVYSRATGNLFYNQNGTSTGLGSGAQFATLVGMPILTANDFLIQA